MRGPLRPHPRRARASIPVPQPCFCPSTTLSHQLHRRKGQKLWSHGGAILAGEADDNINDKFAMDMREAVRGGGATPAGGAGEARLRP